MTSIYNEDFKYILRKIPADKLLGKNWLITGASGFIMSYFIRFLIYMNITHPNNINTLYLVCRSKEKLLKQLGFKQLPGYIFVLQQDVNSELKLDVKIDFIIHAASISSTHLFEKYPVDVLLANSKGLNNILEYSLDKEIQSILFFSSGAVYGSIPDDWGILNESDVFPSDFTQVKNCYTEAKRFGELLMNSYFAQYHLPCKSVRISHTYGPGIDLDDGHVYSDFLKSLLYKKDLIIKGNGEVTRPFCYIADAITAFLYILLYGNNGDVYNMANTKETYSIFDLASLLVAQIPVGADICVKRQIPRLNSWEEKIYVNTNKLEKLGWKPEIGVIEGFKRTLLSFEGDLLK